MTTGLPIQPPLPGVADCDTEFLSRQSTRVTIQETATRRYLSNNGLWTAKLDQAMTFRSGSAAMEHLSQRNLKNIRLVLTRDITVSEIIPVLNFRRA